MIGGGAMAGAGGETATKNLPEKENATHNRRKKKQGRKSQTGGSHDQ